MRYYLAIDIGASSGRHILSHIEDGKILLEEVYRFQNGIYDNDGDLCWDTDNLIKEVIEGIKKCKEIGKIPYSVAIDTWGVDFVLLDKNDNIIGKTYAYRNFGDKDYTDEVEKYISETELYLRTGIQKQNYNSIYQLMKIKVDNPEYLEKAETLLFMPEFLTFKLSGVKKSEYSIATTSGLVNLKNKNWDYELIEKIGLPKRIFSELMKPATEIGNLSKDVREKVGFDCKVVFPCMHDTASAVMAVPKLDGDTLYISSGTWSLLGAELKEPFANEISLASNYTNEGGYGYTYRFLRNIMGLWMMQSIKREYDNKYSFANLRNFVDDCDIKSVVDCQDTAFLAPKSMIETIKTKCMQTGQQVPETPGEIAAVIYNSLAYCYKISVEEIEKILSKKFKAINIVGGGSKDDYLNSLTSKMTGIPVFAGPTEATALGNIAAQMLCFGEFKDIAEIRKCIGDSFEVVKA